MESLKETNYVRGNLVSIFDNFQRASSGLSPREAIIRHDQLIRHNVHILLNWKPGYVV